MGLLAPAAAVSDLEVVTYNMDNKHTNGPMDVLPAFRN